MSDRFAKIILIIVTVFCTLLMIVNYLRSDWLRPIKQYAGLILTPVEEGISSFGNSVSAYIDELENLDRAYEENEELRNELDALIEENNRLKSDALELERLRKLYDLDTEYMQYPKLGARVIASSSLRWTNELKLDKGLEDGIETDMNVIYDGGLLGIVTDVGTNYCTVRTLIDDYSSVYGESQYSGDLCLVQGNMTLYDSGYLEISNIDVDATFNDGDAVITSSLSTKFLPGILIGYASDIKTNDSHLTKSGRLIPAASFEKVKEVLIIMARKTQNGTIETRVPETTASPDESSYPTETGLSDTTASPAESSYPTETSLSDTTASPSESSS